MSISEEMKYQLQIIVDAGEIVKALIDEGHEDIAIFDEPLTDILGATNEVLQEIDGGWSQWVNLENGFLVGLINKSKSLFKDKQINCL